ncbi:1,4-dihydroxy-2-naphthoate polyprenyltransferase [Roseivirga misakiensis]|uniref:1,4-dihydroxy-2-naphthoate octaprenyltransferase n=1 Tax=Roseivirga misakiensis TaxID=1563681 RepID=A0A1E5SL01_9BACT|nr:1,4-dihydroxy-2-naphthoate polyprenyltransferase [Roseivirga misakiensis]OEJ99781.1 1,4-dihydroxy-2-naphthoate octaprenyltransferase [Roseivirga misakiensis]
MKDWLSAFRLRTLPLALASIGMGSFLAAASGNFDGLTFAFCALTTIFLQVLSNLANDYGDSVHGADSVDRKGPSRAVQTGAISKLAMRNAIIVFAILSLAAGIALIEVAFGWGSKFSWIFLGIGALAILAAITYTAGYRPYGYAGLGDLSVLIFFGFVAVMGSAFLYEAEINLTYILPAISVGFFSVAVLNVNNIRDIDSDQKAGKKSIPVRIGRDAAVKYHWFLLFVGMALSVVYVLVNYSGALQLLFILSAPLFLRNALAVKSKTTSEELDPFLKQMALSTLLFVVLFGLGQVL